jgi:hypothetical protein
MIGVLKVQAPSSSVQKLGARQAAPPLIHRDTGHKKPELSHTLAGLVVGAVLVLADSRNSVEAPSMTADERTSSPCAADGRLSAAQRSCCGRNRRYIRTLAREAVAVRTENPDDHSRRVRCTECSRGTAS